MKRIVLIVVVLALALFTLPALTEGVSYDVTITSFTPAAHGTAAYPDGVSGAITFTVTVAKGAQKQTTQPITLAINAAPYAGVSDAQAVEAARAALEGHEDECFFAYGSGEAGRIEAVVTSCEEALSAVPDAAGVTLSPTFAALGGDEYTVTLDITKGEVPARATATAKFFIVETADPRIAEGVAAITGAMDGVKLPVPSTSGNPPDNYPGVVDAAAALAFPVPSDMTVQRTDVAYTAPTDGTPDNQYGDDGAYSFYYTVGNVA